PQHPALLPATTPFRSVDPSAVQESVPIWSGGRTRRSLRRAVELADGWAPFWLTDAKVREWLSQIDQPPAFDVVLAPERPLDPSRSEEHTSELQSPDHI